VHSIAAGATLSHTRDIIIMWAAASLYFFGFFRSGEITVPTEKSFNPTKYLAWGDDNTGDPQSLKVHLRRSIVGQLGKGIDLHIGKIDCPLCPVVAITQIWQFRTQKEAPSSNVKMNDHLQKLYLPAK